MGIPLSGAMVFVAKETKGNERGWFGTEPIRQLHPKSRSGGQLAAGFASAAVDRPGTFPSDDRPVIAGAGHADVVSRTGVRGLGAISIFCRSSSGTGQAGQRRTQGVFVPI